MIRGEIRAVPEKKDEPAEAHSCMVAGEETTAFRQGVEKLLSGRRRVVINLTEVDHIDSTGLAALVHLLTQKRAPESGAWGL